jgi:hypothetical protein
MPSVITAPSPPARGQSTINRAADARITTAIWIVIGLGTLVRCRIYFACRALWADEGLLAMNVLRRPLWKLISEPLDYQQAAPPGFLLLQKWIVNTLGSSEYALRLLPLLSGIATMVLVYLLSRKLATGLPVLLSVALVAFSKGLIEYSVQFKQYETDTTITLLVLLLAVPMLTTSIWRLTSVLLFATVAMVAGWFSHPAAFAVGGSVITILIFETIARRWKNAGIILAAGIPAAAGLCIEYLLLLRPLEHSAFLHHFWIEGFMPLPFRITKSVPWLLTAAVHLMASPGGYKVFGVAPVGFLLGLFLLLQTNRRILALLIFPVLLGELAAVVQAYPFTNRLALFALPPLFVITALGITSLKQWLPAGAGSIAVLILSLIMIVPAIVRAGQWMAKPEPMEEIKPVLSYVHDHMKKDDLLLIYPGARGAFWYYQPRMGLEQTNVVFCTGGDAPGLRADVARLPDGARVWLIVTHANPDGQGSRVKQMLDSLNTRGQKLDHIDGPDATATGYLYDLSTQQK